MGIKVKVLVAVGTGLAAVVATILGIRKKEDERYEKIQEMIRDVDQKKEEPKQVEEPKTVEEMTADVDEAVSGMDIDGDEEMAQQTGYVIEKDGKMVPATREEFEAECKRRYEEAARKREERLENGEWLKEVQEAAKAKLFSKLEDLLNEKYNPYPYHPAPSSPYGQGLSEGVIDEKTVDAARKYYGRLWDYSGD